MNQINRFKVRVFNTFANTNYERHSPDNVTKKFLSLNKAIFISSNSFNLVDR